MKLLKKIFFVSFIFFLLCFISLWVLLKNINSDTIKQMVNNQISILTHKKSSIDGTISWQLLPRPGVKLTHIEIGDDPKQDYNLKIDELSLNLKLSPLIHGTILFSEIDANGFELRINPNKEHKETETASQDNKSTKIKTDSIAIQKLYLNHGKIVLTNNNKDTVFKSVQVGIEQFNFAQKPFPIQIKTQLIQDEASGINKAAIHFKGRMSLSPNILTQPGNPYNNSSIEGQISIQSIRFNPLFIDKINATVKSNKSGISFNPLTLSLYNGESIGTMDYLSEEHRLLLNQTASNLNGKRLISALTGYEIASGTMDYSIHATIPTSTPDLFHMIAKGTVTLKDGEITHLSFYEVINELTDKINNLLVNKLSNLTNPLQLLGLDSTKYQKGGTPFKLASIQFQLQNGVFNSDSLILQTDKLQIKGSGSVNLSDLGLNAKFQASANPNAGASVQKVQKLLGGSIPIVLSGTLTSPKVVPDIALIMPLINPFIITNTLEQPIKKIGGQIKELLH